MTVAERRLDVHDALWRGLSIQQAARALRLPVRTVAADVRSMRRDGVVLPSAETLRKAIEEVKR